MSDISKTASRNYNHETHRHQRRWTATWQAHSGRSHTLPRTNTNHSSKPTKRGRRRRSNPRTSRWPIRTSPPHLLSPPVRRPPPPSHSNNPPPTNPHHHPSLQRKMQACGATTLMPLSPMPSSTTVTTATVAPPCRRPWDPAGMLGAAMRPATLARR